jgi:hypothetical protein
MWGTGACCRKVCRGAKGQLASQAQMRDGPESRGELWSAPNGAVRRKCCGFWGDVGGETQSIGTEWESRARIAWKTWIVALLPRIDISDAIRSTW